ncbi:MAG TPA: HK97-gp10 family putative phage morphogenesis protein [Hyphomicrobiaceae bacterium]|nr:HK97-gp10 family putative phage morphogenesis protein [Hyphomicrobiaceae bacterium]
MPRETVEIQGLRELERELVNFTPKIAKGILRKSISAGAKVFLKELKSRTAVQAEGPLPRDAKGQVRQPGTVRRSMGMRVSMKRGRPTAQIGSRKKFAVAHIARYLELGTGASLVSRSGKLSARSKRYAAKHGGIRPRHFIQDAFNAKAMEVVGIVRAKLTGFIRSYRAKGI